jgi:phosphatidylinositol-4,5-bisphosphate 3-kinase
MLVLFKVGDDIRQDQLTLQVLHVMDLLWKNAGLDMRLSIYGAQATGKDEGFIEVVTQSETIAHITKSSGGATQAFTKHFMFEWLNAKSQKDKVRFQQARETFAWSCAGYCVATHVLGIGDRHNDNLMCRVDGCLFHIDFGHFLGNFKKKFGIEREKAPFVFTPAFAFVLGDKGSELYNFFVDLCCKAYLVLRKQKNVLINLFMLVSCLLLFFSSPLTLFLSSSLFFSLFLSLSPSLRCSPLVSPSCRRRATSSGSTTSSCSTKLTRKPATTSRSLSRRPAPAQ